MQRTCRRLLWVVLGSTPLFLAVSLWACSVPVFRYALEHWHADDYQVIVFHKGPLSDADLKTIAVLEDGEVRNGPPANLRVTQVDLAGHPDEGLRKLWEAQDIRKLPWVVVRYPLSARNDGVVWSGPLPAAAATLRQSPQRREITRLIRAGESAVWVFLESGQADKDAAAFESLEAELKKAADKLKLPEPDKDDDLEGPPEPGPAMRNLRLSFKLLRLSRNDPAEQVLVNMLLGSEDDLKTSPEPMAFPIFGRGRALYALVGAGINADNVQDACRFLVGACSCRVKEQNPGTDLLLEQDWGDLSAGLNAAPDSAPRTAEAVKGPAATAEPSPPSPAVSGMEQKPTTDDPQAGVLKPDTCCPLAGLGLPLTILIGAGGAGAIGLVVWKWKRSVSRRFAEAFAINASAKRR